MKLLNNSINKAKAPAYLKALIALFLLAFLQPAFAQTNTATISIPDTLKGAPGDTIEIPVMLSFTGPEVSALGAVINTTGGILNYLGFSKGPIVPGALLDFNAPAPDSLRMAFADLGGGPITQNGMLAILHFQIDSSAAFGGTSDIALSLLSASDSTGTSLVVNGANGKVTVTMVVSVREERDRLPTEFALGPNYPNPFNPSTTISFQLAAISDVELSIFNLLGQRIRTLARETDQSAGFYTAKWDGRTDNGVEAPAGFYFYRLEVKSQTQAFTQSRKMLLIK